MLTFFNSILLTFKKSLFKLRRILKLELLWTLIPVIVLLLLGIPAFVFFFEITPWLSTFVMVVKSIHIVGNQWYWDVILEAISDDFYL
jgi:heme/copper-type cytochrome/quinol oxidase subunit 2